ncbi:MAG: YigZ family protein [Clostridia bacterium]|nr:YigZ family protein [Clostridia bacterium]
MSQKAKYKTVKHRASTLLVEKKSKFIASVSPADSEEEALEFLKEIKSKYPDATHNVYAYIIDENNIFRYSDDGEPGGTAGMPVLDTIRKEGLVDVCVVVTRYFGGTLLGTGGLVHAYGSSAKQGLYEADIITRALCNVICVKIDYTMSGKIQHMIGTKNLMTDDIVYGDDVTYYIYTTIDETKDLIKEITELTYGRANITVTEQKYIDLKGID